MQNVVVRIPPQTADALVKAAQETLRDPKAQARWYIEDGLRRDGALGGATEVKTAPAPRSGA